MEPPPLSPLWLAALRSVSGRVGGRAPGSCGVGGLLGPQTYPQVRATRCGTTASEGVRMHLSGPSGCPPGHGGAAWGVWGGQAGSVVGGPGSGANTGRGGAGGGAAIGGGHCKFFALSWPPGQRSAQHRTGSPGCGCGDTGTGTQGPEDGDMEAGTWAGVGVGRDTRGHRRGNTGTGRTQGRGGGDTRMGMQGHRDRDWG